MRISSWGHAVWAVTMIACGIRGLIQVDFAPLWDPVPEGVPARAALAYLCAIISLVCGTGLLLRRAAAPAARVLLAFFLLWLLLVRLPHFLVEPSVSTWWSGSKAAVLAAAAWVLYVRLATDFDRQRFAFASGEQGLRIARVLYGLALIPFGIAHFRYVEATAPLVPGWLPGHEFWAYFTGATFIAAGVAVIVGACARLAATLSAWQFGLFLLLVWVPIMAAGNVIPRHRTEIIVTCAIAAAAWVVAESYRGMPWLALNKR